MTEEERLSRGHRARVELNLTEEAFETIRNVWIKKMLAATMPEEVMRGRDAIAALDEVRGLMRRVIDDGMVAAAALEARN